MHKELKFKPESGGAKCLVPAAPLETLPDLPPSLGDVSNPIFLRIAAGRMQRAAREPTEEKNSRA